MTTAVAARAAAGGATISYPDGGEIPDAEGSRPGKAMKAAGCKDETVESDDPYDAPGGRPHDDPNVKYKSEPPALGRHYQEWPEDDIYEEAPPDHASSTRSSTAGS